MLAFFARKRKKEKGHSEPEKYPEQSKVYPVDKKQPYGSKENPIVVGMEGYSTTLIFDDKRGAWILTDGLGNGWIR